MARRWPHVCHAVIETGMSRGRECGRPARAERYGRWLCGYHDPIAQDARVGKLAASTARKTGSDMEPEISAAWMKATVASDVYISPKLCARFPIVVDGMELEVLVATTQRTGRNGPTPDSERMLTIAETIGSRLEKAPRL